MTLKSRLLWIFLLCLGGCSAGVVRDEKNLTPKVSQAEARRLFEEQVSEGLQKSTKFQVRYRNSVGEGPAGWDPLPEAPISEVNCLTWLNFVLTEAFGKTAQEKDLISRRLKYYDGIVAFGARKHFVDQWMAFDPGPLRRIDFSSCGSVSKTHVKLDPQGFAKRVGYTCPLHRSSEVDFQIDYTSPREFAKCVSTLSQGSYVFFLVPEPWYMKKYGKVSGPMGLVHGEILRIGKDTMTVYNASLNSGKVESYPLKDVLEKGLKGFAGLVLFEINPNWDWHAPSQSANTFDMGCEAQLIASGSRKAVVVPESWEDHQRKSKK